MESTTARRLGRGVALALAAAWALPLAFIVLGSLRGRGVPPPVGLEVLPAEPSLASWRAVFDLLPIGLYARNSALVALVAVPLTVAVASLAGFGIRLLRPRLRRAAVLGVIGVLLVPSSAVWATRLEVYRFLGIADTLAALVAPALLATTPFFVLFYVWAFVQLDDEVLDAGVLDGAGPLRLWWSVGLPNAHAATAAVATLAFAFHWGNFLDPLLYVPDPGLTTLPLGLSLLQQLNPTDFPLLLAGAAIVAIPPVVVLLLGQRHFLDPADWTRP